MNKRAERILNTTIQLFLENGIKKTTMDEISERSKSSKMTVYKYFSDKDTLYNEVGKYIFQDLSKRLEDNISAPDDLLIKMQNYINLICDFTGSGYYTLCRELTQYSLDVEKEYSKYKKVYNDTLFGLIDQGIKEKQIKPGLNRFLVFSYIDMGIEYYQNNYSYRFKINNDKKFQEQFMAFYMGNIFEQELQ